MPACLADRVGHVGVRRAGCVGIGILEVVARAPDPTERSDYSHGGAKLRCDGILDRNVTAAASGSQALRREQARGALAECVVGKLIGASQITTSCNSRRALDVPASICQQAPGNGLVDGNLPKLAAFEQLTDLVAPRLPGHRPLAWPKTGTSGRRRIST